MKTIKPLIMEPYKVEGDNGWYNHSTIRNKGYHFCSAITKENLINELNVLMKGILVVLLLMMTN